MDINLKISGLSKVLISQKIELIEKMKDDKNDKVLVV